MLSIIPTPLGNLADASKRSLDTLAAAHFIIAENPAHSAKLLQHYGIGKKEFVQFAEHNEQKMLPKILERLKTEQAALVSDAGTPGVSDPGFRLVRACWEHNISVDSLPGPSAVITALVASGLPTDKFIFCGFLPKTEPKLSALLNEAKQLKATLVAYDSPQRIHKTLQCIANTNPHCTVFIGRELTKVHQTYYRDSAEALIRSLPASLKGEITLVISLK